MSKKCLGEQSTRLRALFEEHPEQKSLEFTDASVDVTKIFLKSFYQEKVRCPSTEVALQVYRLTALYDAPRQKVCFV